MCVWLENVKHNGKCELLRVTCTIRLYHRVNKPKKLNTLLQRRERPRASLQNSNERSRITQFVRKIWKAYLLGRTRRGKQL